MSSNPIVAIHIVTWNHLRHLRTCLAAVFAQTYTPLKTLLVDNASVDGVEHWLLEHYPQLHTLRNTRNLGYARAHNQALRLSSTPYVLFLNPDVILQSDWIERGVRYLETHPEVGVFGGKLLRYNYSNDDLQEPQFSDIIDSTGLQGSRSRHFVDRGSGQTDHGQYDQAEKVFGFSGACGLYRRSALESIRFQQEYIDEDFFAYKDDIDLAWRLQRCGWSAWYDPKAVGYHHRTIKGQSKTADLLIAKNHRSRSLQNSYYSFRNHWLLLAKHERPATWWRDGLWIIWYELKKIVFLMLSRPRALRAIPDALRSWRKLELKGKNLDEHATLSVLEVRQWFV